MRQVMRWVVVVAALAMVTAGCGSDKDDSADKASTKSTTTMADKGGANGGDEGGDQSGDKGGDEGAAPMKGSPYCKLAQEMADQETPPTAEQLDKYAEVRPDEVADEVDFAVSKLKPVAGDVVKFFATVADDDVTAALQKINQAEVDECGVEHDEHDLAPKDPKSVEVDPDATKVDVVASEYKFAMPDQLDAGKTSFVLTDDGKEAHFLLVLKLAEGTTLEQVMQSDDGKGIEGQWSTGLAAPGAEDEEVVNVDLKPGHYAVACFVPGADGQPHAMKGMTGEFTVA